MSFRVVQPANDLLLSCTAVNIAFSTRTNSIHIRNSCMTRWCWCNHCLGNAGDSQNGCLHETQNASEHEQNNSHTRSENYGLSYLTSMEDFAKECLKKCTEQIRCLLVLKSLSQFWAALWSYARIFHILHIPTGKLAIKQKEITELKKILGTKSDDVTGE